MFGPLAAASAQAQAPGERAFASWSPDGKQIVFASSETSRYQIRIRDAQGEVTQITHGEGNNISPAWSPDGGSLIFVSDRDGNFELYTIRTDGSQETRRTQTEGSEMAPDWGAGDRIAFAYSPFTEPNRLGSTSRVFTMDLDGTDRAPLCDAGVQHYPRWSPDGRSLTFSGSVTDAPGYSVWVEHEGAPPQCVSGDRTAFNSDWMPDGSAVVFVSAVDQVAHIFRADLGDPAVHQLTDNTTPWFEPRVSPDGTRILVRVGAGPSHAGVGLLDGAGRFLGMAVATSDGDGEEPSEAPAATEPPA